MQLASFLLTLPNSLATDIIGVMQESGNKTLSDIFLGEVTADGTLVLASQKNARPDARGRAASTSVLNHVDITLSLTRPLEVQKFEHIQQALANSGHTVPQLTCGARRQNDCMQVPSRLSMS